MVNKVASFKDRLNEALEASGKRAIDVVRETGISESTMSQYRSGYAEPRIDRSTHAPIVREYVSRLFLLLSRYLRRRLTTD